ncbi:MAG: thymidine phosphorylase [Candidatus Paracaedibacteraceae bacterium]|nr:thymidine phosphorylase [Candidatus Paracaedibacteraceae bacterium]
MEIQKDATKEKESFNALNTSRILDSINLKRANKDLPSEMIESIIKDFVADRIPDYQMSAWLATVATAGMSLDEIESLTRAYVSGGGSLDHSTLGQKVVDKHSTGGVGDKVTFIVVPIVSACGVPVVKISGRGLGHAGGTLDKLESIAGLKVNLTAKEISNVINKTGMVMTGQSANLVPGDKATYQLRDISGSVESIPLIAASIISKKVATGADCLVLDVKTGSGALIQDYQGANELAEIMIKLAERFGIKCRAVISDMSQPLGYAVGNALEVKEAIEVLKGSDIPGLTELCVELSRLMLQIAKPELTDVDARNKVIHAISSGLAYEKFINWACAQGADGKQLLEPNTLPTAKYVISIKANKSGWVQYVNSRTIGNAVLELGANRKLEGSVIDHSVGVIIRKHVGDRVVENEEIAEIHYNKANIDISKKMILSAFSIGNDRPNIQPIIHRII